MDVSKLFFIVLIIVFPFMFLQRFIEEKNKISSLLIFIIGSTVIILIASLRNNIGDTYVYVESYKNLDNIKTLQDLMKEKDIGFKIFTIFLYKLSSNPQIMIFSTAFITQILNLNFFYKYRSFLELEIYIYITATCYLVTMNGIRQSFAAGIIVYATKYIEDKSFLKYFGLIILATFFHQSALIMIPIYFIVNMNPWDKHTFIILGLSMICFFFFFSFLPILFKFLEHSQYALYFDVFIEGTEKGANPLRLLVSMVPLVLAYIKRESLKEWKCSNIFINMSIINFIFMIFSIRTWIFARFSIYFNLYNCVLLPQIIMKWDNKKERRILYISLIICYFIFFVKDHLGIWYSSNYFLY